ncbi:9382_t:CDS:2 [Entrophospora sp. SA101]|nr:9382_t:CDS:2 [Entrophospora sp. SA101]
MQSELDLLRQENAKLMARVEQTAKFEHDIKKLHQGLNINIVLSVTNNSTEPYLIL